MTQSLKEKIYNNIRRDIMLGQFSPGERLVEIKLAEELQTSRGLIREVLLQLTSENLLTSQKNKGISVPKLTLKQIDEIYSLRCQLEGYAVRLASEKLNKKGLSQLKAIHKALLKATKEEVLTDWTDNNILFHKFFIDNSANNDLIQMLNGLRCRTCRYSIVIITIPRVKELLLENHENIIEAFESNDPVRAQRLMSNHMETAKKILLDHLERFSGMVS